jgi:hypothetical protein
MGKNIAPASRKPHIPSAKQVNTWVNHARKHKATKRYAISSLRFKRAAHS